MTREESDLLKPGDLVSHFGLAVNCVEMIKQNRGYEKKLDAPVITVYFKDTMMFVYRVNPSWIICLRQSKFVLVNTEFMSRIQQK